MDKEQSLTSSGGLAHCRYNEYKLGDLHDLDSQDLSLGSSIKKSCISKILVVDVADECAL